MRLTRPRLRRPGDGRVQVLGSLIALLLLAAALLALLLYAVTWHVQVLLIAAALSHQLMWAAPVALVLALVVRRWTMAGIAALACVAVLLVQVPATVARTAPSGRTVTVLQANLKVGSADPAALVRIVRDNRVDLLATEELTDAAAKRLLAAGLGRVLPYRYLRSLPSGGSGTGVWSRWPLSQQQDLDGFYLGTVRATVDTPDGPVSLVGVHLTPPWPFPEQRWLDEQPRLRALLRNQPAGPVIAPGDYNSTTGHAQFRQLLTDGYRDAIDDAGAGYLPSYPDDRWYGPVIGIDHVLVRDATGTAARTVELPGSDHRTLLVKVVITRER